MIHIADLDNPVEAQILDAMLEEHAIPHLIASREDTAYGSIFQLQHGWGYVTAPESQRDQVLQLLQELRQAR
ncbi:hypothetical protein Spiaf_1979 [Spirochaeta africana DSM 8902]|uniref:Uncharacterized protein n=2 Tax=Spirochaeta TaxID=146 RepID=H9UKI7_SPIAZ|nr:hypothetical protein Spiaf_1979 [Spirochaeta africana DSM 8902]